MEQKKRKQYEQPESTCTVITLESTICSASGFKAQSPYGDTNEIESHKVNTDFEDVNDYSDNNSDWDLGA